jgi:polyhydroxybutyrate depolymerase
VSAARSDRATTRMAAVVVTALFAAVVAAAVLAAHGPGGRPSTSVAVAAAPMTVAVHDTAGPGGVGVADPDAFGPGGVVAPDPDAPGAASEMPVLPPPGHDGLQGVARSSADPERPGSIPAGPAGATGDGRLPARAVAVPGSRPRVDIAPPDGTPLAAAAGTEPDSMSPVDLEPGWVASVHRFSSGGFTRSYLLIRPKQTSPTPLPVLLVLHGRDLTPAIMERISGLWDTAVPSIQVYPAGYGRSWNAGGCCGEAFAAHIHDTAFLDAVVHAVVTSQHDADARRVYAVGFSNGGRMAYRVACDSPGTFAAAVAVEAVPVDQCRPGSPVPILIVANRFDPLLTIPHGARPKQIEGTVEPTVAAEVEVWRAVDGCRPADSVTTDGRVTIVAYDHCQGSGRVLFAEYDYGGHDWSRGGSVTPSAQTLTWAFLDNRVLTTRA